MKRYYPSTRERITRAFNEGVKSDGVFVPRPFRNSGEARRAFVRGWWSARGYESVSQIPVVDLSTEFADVIAEVEADPPKCLERAA